VVSRILIVIGALILVVPPALCAIYRPDRAIRTATAAVADVVCAKTFVSGLDPDAVFAETLERPGIRRLRHLLRYRLDRTVKTVDVSVMGSLAAHSAFTTASAACSCTERRHPICPRTTSRHCGHRRAHRCCLTSPALPRSSRPIPR